jgi:superfamily II DNA/RNA helicase
VLVLVPTRELAAQVLASRARPTAPIPVCAPWP